MTISPNFSQTLFIKHTKSIPKLFGDKNIR